VTSNRIDLMTRKQVRDLAGKLMEEWQSVDAVADVLGCHRSNIRRWHGEYRRRSIQEDYHGKEPGRPSKLTPNQFNIIKDIIFTKTPLELDQTQALWSNATIRDAIADLFKIELSMGTVNTMIRKMGIVRRQIFRQHPDSQDDDMLRWVQQRFPLIRKLAHDQCARLFFVHDEIIETDASGLPPYDEQRGSHFFNSNDTAFKNRMLSAVCPRNSQRFNIFAGPFGAKRFVDFLERLLHDTNRHLFLIAEAHYKPIALEADHFLSSNANRVSLFFLPGGNGQAYPKLRSTGH